MVAGDANQLTVDVDRSRSLHAAARVSAVSLLVSLTLGTLAFILSAGTASLVLAAFGAESFIDGAASGVLVWRFGAERREPGRAAAVERKARTFVGVVLLVTALSLAVAAVRNLIVGPDSHPSAGSVVLAIVAVLVLPGLGWAKLRLAGLLESRALRSDGLLTMGGAVLAGITLLALMLTRLWHLHSADPIAAIVVGVVLAREGFAAVRG